MVDPTVLEDLFGFLLGQNDLASCCFQTLQLTLLKEDLHGLWPSGSKNSSADREYVE